MPKFEKGSVEAKEWAKKMANAKAVKAGTRTAEGVDEKVNIMPMGKPKIVIPEWFATRTKKGWKLVNPITQERNLSHRNNTLSVKILRKPVSDAVILDGEPEPINLALFTPKDRAIIRETFDKIEVNSNKSVAEKPIYQLGDVEERGRPEILPKNIRVNKERKAEAQKALAKKRGRPSKYNDDEEARKQAKKDQDREANIRRTEKRRQAKLQGKGLSDSEKNNIYATIIEMPKKSKTTDGGMGLYAGEPSGRGMYAGDGFFGDLAKSALKSGASMAVDAGANYAKNRLAGNGMYGTGSGKPNQWVEHIRAFAKNNNMTYGCAMSDPRIRDGYVSASKSRSKTQVVVKPVTPTPKAPLTPAEEKRLKMLKTHLERMDMMRKRGMYMDEDQREDIEAEIKELSGTGFFGDLAKKAVKAGASMAVDAGAKYAKDRLAGNGMFAGDGLYASGGEGMYGAGMGAGCFGGCGMCGGAIYNPNNDPEISKLNDHIRMVMGHHLKMGMSGQGIFGDIGRWFKKAGRTINKAVIKPVGQAFSKGGVMEDIGKKVGGFALRDGLPFLANLGADAIGQPELGALATPFISKGADALARSAGVGMKKPNAWIQLVKRVQQERGVSYKEAMSIASQMRQR